MDPKLKIRKAMESGELGHSYNMDGERAGAIDWYENKPINYDDIYLDRLDDWDK
jgi:hypothetical protein